MERSLEIFESISFFSDFVFLCLSLSTFFVSFFDSSLRLVTVPTVVHAPRGKTAFVSFFSNKKK